MVGELAGKITSKAVLSLLLGTGGHRPVLRCGQEKLNKMEKDFKKCTRRVQYQVTLTASKIWGKGINKILKTGEMFQQDP